MTGVSFITEFGVTAVQRRDLEALRALQVQKAQLAARELDLLVQIAGPHMQVLAPELEDSSVAIADPIRSEICLATGWSEHFARTQLETARMLATSLPLTAAALAAGTIGAAHARVMVTTMQRFDIGSQEDLDRLASRVEARIMPNTLDRTRPLTLSSLRAMCQRAVVAVDPKGALLRAKKARQDYGVWVVDDVDGVSELHARMSSLAAHACLRRLDAMVAAAKAELGEHAASDRDPEMTIGQWRVDALETLILNANAGRQAAAGSTEGANVVPAGAAVQAVDGAVASGSRRRGRGSVSGRSLGERGSVSARIDIVMDLDLLLGLRDGMGTLDGVAEVDAQLVRDLFAGPDADVTLRRLVTDPLTGDLLDVGRSSYTPSDRLREFIILRDRRCRFPGCGRHAQHADIDHAQAWNDNGTTDRANLGALCRRHHLLKTHAGYDITQSTIDGSCVWKTPSGAIIRHQPEPLTSPSPPPPDDEPPF